MSANTNIEIPIFKLQTGDNTIQTSSDKQSLKDKINQDECYCNSLMIEMLILLEEHRRSKLNDFKVGYDHIFTTSNCYFEKACATLKENMCNKDVKPKFRFISELSFEEHNKIQLNIYIECRVYLHENNIVRKYLIEHIYINDTKSHIKSYISKYKKNYERDKCLFVKAFNKRFHFYSEEELNEYYNSNYVLDIEIEKTPNNNFNKLMSDSWSYPNSNENKISDLIEKILKDAHANTFFCFINLMNLNDEEKVIVYKLNLASQNKFNSYDKPSQREQKIFCKIYAQFLNCINNDFMLTAYKLIKKFESIFSLRDKFYSYKKDLECYSHNHHHEIPKGTEVHKVPEVPEDKEILKKIFSEYPISTQRHIEFLYYIVQNDKKKYASLAKITSQELNSFNINKLKLKQLEKLRNFLKNLKTLKIATNEHYGFIEWLYKNKKISITEKEINFVIKAQNDQDLASNSFQSNKKLLKSLNNKLHNYLFYKTRHVSETADLWYNHNKKNEQLSSIKENLKDLIHDYDFKKYIISVIDFIELLIENKFISKIKENDINNFKVFIPKIKNIISSNQLKLIDNFCLKDFNLFFEIYEKCILSFSSEEFVTKLHNELNKSKLIFLEKDKIIIDKDKDIDKTMINNRLFTINELLLCVFLFFVFIMFYLQYRIHLHLEAFLRTHNISFI